MKGAEEGGYGDIVVCQIRVGGNDSVQVSDDALEASIGLIDSVDKPASN